MHRHQRRGTVTIFMVLTIMLTMGVMGSAPAAPESGYLTDEGPYITLDPGLPSGATVKGIINSGDVLGDFTFEGIPDGIGIRPGSTNNTVDVYVAHEQSTVPFRNARDVQDSSISMLTLDTKAGSRQGSVLAASVALGPELGYLRFCSASMAGPAEGFSSYTFFTGEETNDVVAVPPGAPYGPDFVNNTRQGGYAVALNTDTGESTPIVGMGRLNHENTVAVPGGWDQLALLTTDDTFSAPSSQLYLYLADDDDAVFNDEGTLWAMRVTSKNGTPVDPSDPFNGANDYLDLGVDDEMTAEFIPVPDAIADGPQDGLEQWSNDNNVFQSIRLEDLAYDKNDPRVVYIADTGATRVVPDAATGRLVRGPSGTIGFADNGRMIQLVLNADDPTVVDSLTVLADGDAVGSDKYVPFTSPDNVDTSKKSLMVQEDTDGAQIFQYRFRQGTWRVVASINDPFGESSGIVDASEWFGGGRWLLDVQGHGANVFEEMDGGVLVKRESGQLMLLNIPGS